jgi:hypothetical protein
LIGAGIGGDADAADAEPSTTTKAMTAATANDRLNAMTTP